MPRPAAAAARLAAVGSLRAQLAALVPALAVTFVAGCGGETESQRGGRPGSEQLPAVPEADGGYPWCAGEPTEFVGPCCHEVYCYTPPSNVACPDTQAVTQAELGVDAPGSGRCECGRDGPFVDPAQPDACCYVVGVQSCMGRPLRVEGRAVTAAVVDQGPLAEDAWRPEGMPADDVGTALARAWADDALLEHASVAAFSRLTLQLMAQASPPDLLALAQQAALDEVDHAHLLFALASGYQGRTLDAGPLPLPDAALAPVTLPELIAETVRDGCAGETFGSLEARVAAGLAADAHVRATLSRIAEDEGRHAALAFRIVRWGLGQGGAEVAQAVGQALAAAATELEGPDPAPDTAWEGFGRLGLAERRALRRSALADVVRPALLALLAEAGLADEVTVGARA